MNISFKEESILLLAVYLLGVATPLIMLRLMTKDHEDTCLLNLMIAVIITVLIVLITLLIAFR
jgi:hypothetical protein